MKYFRPFLILSVSFLIISFTTGNQNKLKTGFYYLAKTENDGQIVNDVDSEDRYAVDQQEVLNTGDFKAAKIVTLNAQPNRLKTIELTLTKNGRKKWVEIQNRMSKTGESL